MSTQSKTEVSWVNDYHSTGPSYALIDANGRAYAIIFFEFTVDHKSFYGGTLASVRMRCGPLHCTGAYQFSWGPTPFLSNNGIEFTRHISFDDKMMLLKDQVVRTLNNYGLVLAS